VIQVQAAKRQRQLGCLLGSCLQLNSSHFQGIKNRSSCV